MSEVCFVDNIAAIDKQQWQDIAGSSYPFLRYEFLHALEEARGDSSQHNENSNESYPACCRKTGWQPHHALIKEAGQIVGLMPLYLKHHSYGEYIFDWAWADAYHRHNIPYYPKLLAAIPYTPATGPRLVLSRNCKNQDAVIASLDGALIKQCRALNASSFHLLYPEHALGEKFAQRDYPLRQTFQYHWFNNNSEQQPFSNFDDFASSLKSRKRKAIAKERRQITEQGIHLTRLVGSEINSAIWEQFYYFYQLTYAKRSGHGGYLGKAFFIELAETMPEQIMMVVASTGNQIIACALNFFSSDTLYGRYWGCSYEAEFLHFEACYYQGIEFCIERGLKKFDAGAQGEHKIQRGFVPVPTYSNHWIADENFRLAIGQFINEEKRQNRYYMQQAANLLPFRQHQAKQL